MVYNAKIIGSNPAVVNSKLKELQTRLEQEELVIPKYQRMNAKNNLVLILFSAISKTIDRINQDPAQRSSRQQDGRSRCFSGFEITLGLGGVLQRITLADLNRNLAGEYDVE